MVFQKLAIHENFQVGDLTVGPLLTWRHGLQGNLLPNDDALGVPFGGWCWKGGGCIVQLFFLFEKRMCRFSSKLGFFCQNMHLSFSLLEGPNLTIPIEMLKNAFFRPPLLKESLGILQVSHLRTQTLGVGPRWVFWKKQREPKLLRVV